MSKKVAVIVGGGSGLGAALAKALLTNPDLLLTTIDTGESTDGKLADVLVGNEGKVLVVDEAGENMFYDPKMIDALTANMSDRELYGITMGDARALINDRKLGEYKIPDPFYGERELRNKMHSYLDNLSAMDLIFDEDLPQNTTKPAFLMRQDHHIRKVRR